MFTDKHEVFIVRLNGKNYPTWTFQMELFIKGKELWGHIDGTDSAPAKSDKDDAHAKWVAKDAQVMTWITGSIDPTIVLNLRPFTTAQESLSISEFYSHFMNLWSEYTNIVYQDLSTEGQTVMQKFQDTTKRDQFLMKLRSDFEGLRSNLMNRATVPSLDDCLNELLREEQRLLTQKTMEQQKAASLPLAYVVQGRPRGREMSTVQCFCCKGHGHYASNCPKKFCNYCKKDGHIIKECPSRPPKKTATAFTASVGSSTAPIFVTFLPPALLGILILGHLII
ncbi:polyadenylate-binding protein 3 [Trifolium pratense]|uniref:Polyadenylate-binding protein 3 n=2 Tax=Trifolium pratense TaxID=57577 RepID=A0A2K3JKE5_TRIPR|nr:polyadenylate-binding protein 3 [Trifolium pratense]